MSIGRGRTPDNNVALFGSELVAGSITKRQVVVMFDFIFGLSNRFPLARWALIPVRLIVGYGFMEHGFAKLSKGIDALAAILTAMGVPAPHLMAWLTISTEIGGGAAVLLGGLVALAAVPMAAVLLVAVFTVHLPYGFSSIKLLAVTAAGAQFGPPGYEVDLLYLACLAALVMGGAGPFAIDGLIRRRYRQTSCREEFNDEAIARKSIAI
jgi:putative oxidoreductase